MPADRTMKQGATWPPLRATLTAGSGPLDLTNADEITVVAKSDGHLIEGVCTVIAPPTAGRVEYVFQPGDTNQPGTYKVEFEIEWSPGHGQDEIVPNTAVRELVIESRQRPAEAP